MPHVLVAGRLHAAGREVLDAAAGLTATYVDEISEESYAPLIGDADAVLIRTQPMSAATIAKAPRLKIVSRHGVGYDAVDVNALNARGIALAVCGDVNSASVAEHTMMMVLAASKRALRADTAVRQGRWTWRNRLETEDLCGRNLLILGYGRIGRHTAKMASGFGLTIRAYDPILDTRGWPEGAVAPVGSLEEGLAWADIITVSAPKGDGPLIGPSEFAQMKGGVVLVNCARGGIVDEDALAEALRSGKIGAGGLDVFDTEPLAPDHPLRGFDQLILSPHIAGLTEGATARMAMGSAQNIVDFFAGKINSTLVVNKDQINVETKA